MPGGKWRLISAVLFIAMAATVFAFALGETRIIRLLHLKSGDLYFVAAQPEQPKDIVLIVVDQKSLDRFPEPLLLWHGYYEAAIEAAADAGAKVLGLDVAFPIPVNQWAAGFDERMAQAVISTSTRMPVMCGYAASTLSQQRKWPVPMNMAAAAMGQMAYVNLRADEDDFIRSIELAEAEGSRSMSLAVSERFLGRPVSYPQHNMLIHYVGPAGTFPRVSLCDFIDAARAGRKQQLRDWVSGKAVLLGPDLITDRHATPFYAFRAGTPANTAGVEIHANAVWTLLSGRHIVPLSEPVKVTLTAAVSLGAALVTLLVAGWPLFGYLVLLAALSTSIGFLLFGRGLLVAPSEILLPLLISGLLSLVYGYFFAARGRDTFRNAVRVFVGKQVAEALDASGKIALSGRREAVTILFTDIRGFTAWCDTQEPETVVARLNEYFAVMTACIVRHGGQVNKFIGDGIMAIFSDAEGAALGDHALRAVRCAVEMVGQPLEFRTGAGIHTGDAIVGNVGSGDKMDYTALGDTVNLAARLEGLNKEFQTRILMSAATWDRVKGSVEARRLGQVPVRGKSVEQSIYTVAEV
ncbi:adenylate/guanylate cyclase domain-containing protein [Paludibaculum fermentans]|uniref:Adenylate/guanylate cyclase domain-containing protein n=1 Tax=Paludibaculum fermentans TaxID=1473598 RepID=A0A7S7NM90_PALFE|nr:adenylate/guanylate cyclase domain-containing protein [Paludibaculum fermentans]QOY86164.1 adenylate/guanylate cyclase domain-containing protein [Paludibaculum fermentans]